MNEQMCVVNEQGNLLEILQKDILENECEFKVKLSNYYDVLNGQRYPNAKYDFKLKTFVGVGEQRPLPISEPTETEMLKQRLEIAERTILELMMGGVQ